jgi:hypothetical protein
MAGKMTIRELLVKIGVSTDKAKLTAFDKALESAKKTALAVTAAITGAAIGIYKIVSTAAAAADDAAAMSARLGLTTESYQELGYVASRADMSIEEMSASLRVQSKNLDDARRGGKETTETLKRLGLAAKDIRLKDQSSAFDLLITRMRGVKDAQERMALAQKLWGRGGTALIPLIDDQTLSVKALREEAHRLGIVMSKEQIAAGSAFDDAMKDAQFVVQGLRNQIGLSLAPVLSDLLGQFTDWAMANREIIATRAREWLMDFTNWAIRTAKDVRELVEALGGLKRVLEAVVLIWAGSKLIGATVTLLTLFKELRTVLAGIGAIVGVSAGGVFALILAAVASLAVALSIAVGEFLLLEDAIVWLRGGNSVIGDWIAKNREASTVLGSVARALDAVGDLIKSVAHAIGDQLSPYVKALSKLFEALEPYISRAADALGRFASSAIIERIERLTGAIRSVTGFVQNPSLAGVGDFAGSAARASPGVVGYGARAIDQTARAIQGARTSSVRTGDVHIHGVGVTSDEAERIGRNLLMEQVRAASAQFATGDR